MFIAISSPLLFAPVFFFLKKRHYFFKCLFFYYCGAKILFAPQKERVKALSEAGLDRS
jgi:hypothetical protein